MPFPGLSRPGILNNKIPGLSRVCTNPAAGINPAVYIHECTTATWPRGRRRWGLEVWNNMHYIMKRQLLFSEVHKVTWSSKVTELFWDLYEMLPAKNSPPTYTNVGFKYVYQQTDKKKNWRVGGYHLCQNRICKTNTQSVTHNTPWQLTLPCPPQSLGQHALGQLLGHPHHSPRTLHLTLHFCPTQKSLHFGPDDFPASRILYLHI